MAAGQRGVVHVAGRGDGDPVGTGAPGGVEDVDLFVYADDGTSYGSDEAPDKRPTLMVCPGEAQRLYVVARIAQGNGHRKWYEHFETRVARVERAYSGPNKAVPTDITAPDPS